jgi:hypothetical protein
MMVKQVTSAVARYGVNAVIALTLIGLGACSSIIPGADRDPP